MQIQYINEMLQIPEVQINEILFVSDHGIHIEMTPLDKSSVARFISQITM